MVQLSDYTHQVVSNNNGNHLNPMLLLTSLVPVSRGQIEMGGVCLKRPLLRANFLPLTLELVSPTQRNATFHLHWNLFD